MHYHSPTDLTLALQFYAQHGGMLVAGGTDVYPSSKQGHAPRNLLDLTRVSGLSGIEIFEDIIRIGAATSWSDIVAEDLPPAFNALKQAAREVGSIQIQNAGTIGGNLCNASPAADGVPPLLALDASVELASAKNGTRVLKLSEFILGVRKTALQDDEILTAVIIPTPNMGEISAFEKLGSRRYLVISITMVAANIVFQESGAIKSARIAVGSCSPVAQRLFDLEGDVVGLMPDEVRVLPEHLSPLSPIDDVRGSGSYRLDVVAAQCVRAIERAAQIYGQKGGQL